MKEKQPIDISNLDAYASEETSLADACLDYLNIEHVDQKDEVDSHISQHFQQRLRTGKSVAVRIDYVIEDTDDDSKIKLIADVDYSSFPYRDPEKVLSALRLKASSGTSSGSFVRAIPVDGRLNEKIDTSLNNLAQCPTLTVEDIRIDPENPTQAKIVLNALKFWQSGGKFLYGQPQLSHGREDEPGVFSAGDRYILDPSPDDHTAESAYYSLRNPEYNGMLDALDGFLNENSNVDNTSDTFDVDAVESFIEWMRDDNSNPLPANAKQGDFISDVEHEISLLQGPPGTGKTSGAVAPAIVARLLGYDEPGPCRALITGASNKSINEVMDDVHDLLEDYRNDPATGDELDDVLLVRATQPPDDEDERLGNVAYTAFYDDEAEASCIHEIQKRVRKDNLPAGENEHIIVFATARRTWRLGKAVIDDFALQPDSLNPVTGRVKNGPPEPHERRSYRLFDVMVADEASMMNLPQFLLSGTFYDPGGNILLSGDHRQLPPVRKHDWNDEFRPSVTSLAPYLSVLNFFRLLKGDDLQVIDDDLQDLIDITSPTDADIPLHQLEITYRCHTRVAEFLRNWVYWKLDGLEYSSDQTDTIADPVPSTDGIGTVMAPEQPLVVVTYDDQSSQQANELEATLATQIIEAMNWDVTDGAATVEEDDGDEAGIVTPHNAQRGLLETTLEQDSPEDAKRTDIDTVERFQGGERDLVLVSGTVSDPDYVAAESEFLLNLNRLNVAMSRMKKKLVVIASESIFDHIPLDVDEYNQALLWKGLAKEAGLADDDREPDWHGSVPEFTGLGSDELSDAADGTTIRVYCM